MLLALAPSFLFQGPLARGLGRPALASAIEEEVMQWARGWR